MRQAVLLYAFERAVETNLRRLHGRARAHPENQAEMLTAEVLQAALGKTPPKSRTLGVSGQVPIGVSMKLNADDGSELIKTLRAMRNTREAERVVDGPLGLELWFRGPRPLGEFLLEWCEERGGSCGRRLDLLDSPQAFVAILPDDMLAMQELFLARQGMSPSAVHGVPRTVSTSRTAPTD